MERGIGAMLIVLGLVAVAIGVLVNTGALSWFGRLPGDLKFGSDRMRVYIPITSMLLVSAVLSGLLTLLGFFRR